mgnify:CR=1 FL=1
MYSKCVIMRNPSGLHARPASEFVAKAKGFQSKISVRRPGDDSFLGIAISVIVMPAIGVRPRDSIEILADGPDEQQAVESLTALVESGFGEI